jgi:spermidine/putrescine-binding protein
MFSPRVLVAAGIASLLVLTPARAEEMLAIANYGGSYGEAMWKAVWEPTAKKLGVTIKQYSLNSLADIRAQVSAKAVEWDIGELTIDECALGAQEGLFETLDYKVIDPKVTTRQPFSRPIFSTIPLPMSSAGIQKPSAKRGRRAGPTSGM